MLHKPEAAVAYFLTRRPIAQPKPRRATSPAVRQRADHGAFESSAPHPTRLVVRDEEPKPKVVAQ